MKILGYALCCLVIFSFVFFPKDTSRAPLTGHAGAIKNVSITHKVIALTFDDGPEQHTTPKILNVLREKKVHATFFVVGENVERLPNILVEELKDGHEIGNHTYSHRCLSRLSKARINEELDKAEKVIDAIAPKITLFRPPGGSYDKRVLNAAADRGYTTVLWTVDPHDWRRPPVERLVNNILHDVKPGSIILLHDGKYPSPTPEAVAIVIDRLRNDGYELVTVSELLQQYELEVKH